MVPSHGTTEWRGRLGQRRFPVAGNPAARVQFRHPIPAARLTRTYSQTVLEMIKKLAF